MKSDKLAKEKLEKINSKYILKILFNNLEKKKLYTIIKYNNKLKERIDININDYIKYSQKYSSIEIELKVKSIRNEYDKYNLFINIPRDEEFIMIYILIIMKKKK